MRKRWWLALAGVALVASVSLVVAGLAAAGGSGRQATKVTVQLKWVTQAQFAGYYAAKAKGFYDRLGLDVDIKVGGPDIIPEQVVLGKQAEFGVDWLPSLLATRDKGGKIVNVAQVFTRSGVTEVVFRDSGITNFCQLKGKKVGVWLGGNEFEQYAALQKCGINPSSRSDVTIVKQNFDMVAFLQRQIDAASAMTYNELAQVLETKNPKTGKLYTLKDLRVFKMQNLGTGMLEDGLFVREDWIKDKANQATAVKFIQGTLQGWIYCRTHFRECVNIVLKNGPTLGRGHQTWQMNEINALVWPAPKGVGIMDPKSYAQTARISLRYKVINKPAGKAYVDTYAKRAVAALKRQGLDVNGRSWKPAKVTVTPGGK